MVFKRVFMPMLVLGIMLGLSSMAYAQTVTCTVGAPLGATGVATATGHTEPIAGGVTASSPPQGTMAPAGGTVRVTCVEPAGGGDATTSVGTLTINLGVPITSAVSTTTTNGHPPGLGIRVVDGTGAFVATVPYAGTQNVGVADVNEAAGIITIGLGTPGATTSVNPTVGIFFADGTTSTFDIEGVLVGLNGSGRANVDAVLAIAGGAGYNVGATNSVRVIETVQAGLKDPTVPTGTLPAAAAVPGFTTGGAASLNSAGVAIKGYFTIRIEEGYLSMFKDNSQFNGGAIFPASGGSDTQVNVVFSDVPAGLAISGCSALLTDAAGTIGTAGSPTLSASTVSNIAPVLTVNFNAAVDQLAIDVLWITCTGVSAGTATIPLPTTNVTAKVTLAPTGTALTGMGAPRTGLTDGQIPRYQETLIPATGVTVVTFPPAATTLLVPFAAVGGTFNTGIAIANASTTPTGGALQTGTITFTMYKNDGTSRAYTTAAGSPGSGLNATGALGTGGTYTVNVSELLSAAGFGTTFLGYIYITTNFTEAHGAATIYVTSSGAATLSTPVLVVAGAGLGQ
jgi:hypothetical protein